MLQNNSSVINEQEKRHISQKEAIERILDTSDGSLLLEYLSDLVLFDVGEFADNSNAMFFKEGRRSILTTLLGLKNMDLLKYIKQVRKIQIDRFNERV